MIYIICRSCRFGLRVSSGGVSDDATESSSLLGPGSDMFPDAYPCAKCGGLASFCSSVDPVDLLALELHDVTPQEAWAALHGLGLPEERDCGAAAVERALLSSPVKAVLVHPIRNSHRSLLETIELQDGTKIYLGASAYGATVYRVSVPTVYAERVKP